MNLTEELQKLETLYQNGSLSASEFAQAKTALLNAPSQQAQDLGKLAKEAKLLRLDRDWQMVQEGYMVRAGRYGGRRLPTVGNAWTSILFMGGFGVFWTFMAFTMTSNVPSFGGSFDLVRLFPIFGIGFTAFSVWGGFDELSKARAYDSAQLEYHQQRRELETQP